MIACRIVAETPAGLARADAWSPSLDGVLAYWALRETLSDEAFADGMSGFGEIVEADLPLGRETDPETGAWWWQVSSPIVRSVGEHRRHFHRRFDAQAAERFTDATTVNTTAGPMKAYRMPLHLTLTPTVTYHAIGDPDAIRRLLRRCISLGAKGSHGCGWVRGWHITPDGDPDLARWHRPLPEAYARQHGRTGTALSWGLRPPARAHRQPCLLPVEDDAAPA